MEDVGQNESDPTTPNSYLNFPHLDKDATRGHEQVLNRYSTFITRDHDYPPAKVYQMRFRCKQVLKSASLQYGGRAIHAICTVRSGEHSTITVRWRPEENVLDLGKEVKSSIVKQGFLAWQYNTIGVSDAITMGHDGMRFSLQSREIIADSIETVTCAQVHDACVAIPGCDKNLPGVVMGLARHNRPSVIVYGGTQKKGFSRTMGKYIDMNTPSEARGAYIFGTLKSWSKDGKATPEQLMSDIEHNAAPGPGGCGGMYTANSLAMVIETLGLSLPGSSSTPAQSPSKSRECARVGEVIRTCLEKDIRPSSLLTRRSFENALVMLMALGGSTNAVLHILAMAKTANVELLLDDFQRVSTKTPYIANLAPSGKYFMEDLFEIGGVPSVMKLLIVAGLLDGSTPTVTGKTLGENVKSWPSLPQGQEIIKSLDNPIKPSGHIEILYGNIAPGGAVAKITGKEGLSFAGRARVFDKEQELCTALDQGRIRHDENLVLVVRYEGPKGGPGMPEQLRASGSLIGAGYRNVALITDGRYSGASHGFIVGHIVPEAAVGGPIAVIQDDDMITIDVKSHRIAMPDVTDEEIQRRLSLWKPPKKLVRRGTLAKYAHIVGNASEGALTDLF